MHCLSFDVEEHFQVSAFESPLRRQNWGQEESRVERNVSAIVDLLAIRGTKATFFTLGWIAERHPRLVKQLADAGHEIASHGYGHEMITAQTPDQFREDVRKAKSILENLTGGGYLGIGRPALQLPKRQSGRCKSW